MFSQRNMIPIFVLFGCMSLMSTMVSSVQNAYTNALLGFDARHNADLCWGVVAGITFDNFANGVYLQTQIEQR